ncbi:MAG: energy-coupling factor transporter transmembrane component T family protein [Gemmataceae bacterium]
MTLAFDALDAPDSRLARLDPRWKLAALLPAILVAAALASPPVILMAFLGTLALLARGRLPRRMLVTRLGAFAVLLLPFLVILPLTQGSDGLLAAAKVAGRATAVFGLGLVLIATAPFARTMQAAEAMGLPVLFARLTLMSYRYVFVLADEFARLRTALRVRGFRNRANLHSYRTIGRVTGTLLVRGDARAERVAQAMRCRGFDGRFRALHGFRTRPVDVLFFLGIVGPAAALLAWDLWLRS